MKPLPRLFCIAVFSSSAVLVGNWPETAHCAENGTLARTNGAATPTESPFKAEAVDASVLAVQRGGTNLSIANQGGVVEANSAYNTFSGGNVIASGAFANAGGMAMVIQNSGNNVLIQNSTIVNVQIK